MYYKQDLGYVYPTKSDEHMLVVKKKRDTHFDENYDYLDKTFFYKIKRIFLWIVLNIILFPFLYFKYGLKIYGRKNFKKNKKLYANGAITICNHVFMLDYCCVLKAIRPHLQYHIAWKTNFEGSNAGFIRLVGGIPIPTDNARAMVKFKRAVDEVLESGKWLHVFPEGSMWWYYPAIRPLKHAVFKFAYVHNKPVIPITISFRPIKGLFKLYKRRPCVDLHIGDPLLPDLTLSQKEGIDKLHKDAYHIMQVMNGITPGHPAYSVDQNIDNYKRV